MTRAEWVVLVEVLGSIWLDGDDADPPTLELRLSDGRYLKLAYDLSYSHPLVWAAENKAADFVSIPARESGLGDALEPYLDQVAHAAECHASNQRAEWMGDAMSFEDYQR